MTAPAPDVTAASARDDAFGAAAPRRGLRGRVSTVDGAMALAGALALPLGIVMVFLGWFGAARTPYLFEQVPYLVSGGLLGLALVISGGFVLFGAWVARSAREQRDAAALLLLTLQEVRDELAQLPAALAPALVAPPAQRSRRAGRAPAESNGNGNGHAPADGHAGAGLVATARGSMIHRPECAVVVGREDLHAVSGSESPKLSPCRLCDPLAPAVRTRA